MSGGRRLGSGVSATTDFVVAGADPGSERQGKEARDDRARRGRVPRAVGGKAP
jgi:hypothetical protein